jgi:hypothetical protein
MNLFKGRVICLLGVLLVGSLSASAQYNFFDVKPLASYITDAGRWEIGGSYTMTNGTFNGVIPIYGNNNRYLTDSTLKRSVAAQPGFGGFVGFNAPIKALGHVSCIALSVNLSYTQFEWKEINKAYNLDGSYKMLPHILNAKTTQIALPVGLDYKIGNDAINSKRMFLGASVGAGLMPQVNITAMDSVGVKFGPQQSIGCNGYGKAEVSFCVGFCVKLRAMYSMGNIELLNLDKSPAPPYTHGPFNITSNSQVSFSLVLMPFSPRKWRETGWYNTYDSYNWNERLN